ncbi:glycerophosphodiester phosphodiesterase [Aurantiacibacter poecillastricola]|uniref:glycerophosphodiester phosphodiesterase n=1 Tax=Aurantiacibacter poecillastricola TaxID=3064385 RepID=UPI00273E17F0|nr:glycerophosphodiester phosphodiesterase [Aurantiacibacter sp. 219JJ12-13]MDP5260851.1 glycerophosphodiester phosphodiesterase [Aurantiacibacter sp. 219JJ12-13]
MTGKGLILLAALVALCWQAPIMGRDSDFIVIAHRGASGERPEHTLAAYERAIEQGVDYIEPDLVATQDGVLVARHENEISGTTDVDQRPEFAARLTTRMIDGEAVTGWFTEDFTLAELRTLRARERLPEIRPANTAFDGLYQVPTLAEIIALVRAKEAETGRTIGLYPEIKHPTYFAGIGHDLAAMLVEELHAAGYDSEDAPVFIQSFEIGPLVRLDGMTDLRLVQLVSAAGGPADRPDVTYPEMLSETGLVEIARYADGIGAAIPLLLDETGGSTGLASRARAEGLDVHAWTLRAEEPFLPPAAMGCEGRILNALRDAGATGVFADSPGRAVAFRDGSVAALCAASDWEDDPVIGPDLREGLSAGGAQ